MILKKVFDTEVQKPKEALSKDQWPTEVEDPVSGEMKSVGEEVSDAADDTSKAKLYNLLRRFVPQMLKSMYPSYLEEGGTTDDAVSQIYIWNTTPTTSKEDIAKLREEDAKSGKSHSMNWYRYQQDEYPKSSRLDWFDPEKSSIEGFAYTAAKQGIGRLMTKDPTLKKNEEGKWTKVARLHSMDQTDEEGNSAIRSQAESKSANSAVDTDLVKKFSRLDPSHKRAAIARIKDLLAQESVSVEVKKVLRELLKDVDNGRKEYGSGMRAKTIGLESRVNEEFPLGTPKIVVSPDHTRRMKFSFNSPDEAQEAAEKYDDEMSAKGLALDKVKGKNVYYKVK